ncbi:MAG: trehalose-6-phosphate synthase [Pseudomonadota bacterium]
MGRLVIVSNRVADLQKGTQAGGLATAVGDALRQSNGFWVGWDGAIVDENTMPTVTINRDGEIATATTPLTRQEYDEFYLGFSNSVLWPAFHYRLDLIEADPRFVGGYRRVLQRLANLLVPLLEPDDTIWIHDYHLIPLAAELRAQAVSQKIGFFLHIPFPPPDIFAAVPDHEWLARSLFSYDLVGFQTVGDATNFRRYVLDHLGGVAPEKDRVAAFETTLSFGAFPIGIDVENFRLLAMSPQANERISRLKRRNIESNLIIGVDRLDYSKGLAERMRAFEKLLELYPENRGVATLMQIAPPTRQEVRAYSEMHEELERLSGAINGAFADFDWTPVRYIHRQVARETLAAVFRGSAVGLVTPLRDGMNLVAKEYIAAQNVHDPGVLVLSQFAGAAEELTEAVIVNPYNIEEMAQAMQRALRMSLEERQDRHDALLKNVQQTDVATWQRSFLSRLDSIRTGPAA